MRRIRRERGAIAVIAAITIPAIIIVAMGTVMIGRILTTRQRLQYAADAVATQGALLAKRHGLASPSMPNSQVNADWLPSLGAMQAQLATLRNNNLALAGTATWPTWSFENVGGGEWVRSQSRLTTSVMGYELSATVAMRLRQFSTRDPSTRPLALILVLDFSNSMNASSASFGVAITQLRNAVNAFLGGLSESGIRIGAIVYGSNVYAAITPATKLASGDFADIRAAIAGAASGDTNTGAGLDAAVDMLLAQTDNFGRNILLISDGQPCCSAGADERALAAGARARANDTQVFTVEVHHVNSGGAMHDSLLAIAGTATQHFEVENAAALNALFQGVSAQALCEIEVTGNIADATVFLQSESGAEQPLIRYETSAQIGCPDNCTVLGYRVEGTRVVLSPSVCDLVRNGGRTAIVRWGGTVMAL